MPTTRITRAFTKSPMCVNGQGFSKENSFVLNPATQRMIDVAPIISTRYYGCDIYLVGSAQTSSDPRDIDVVVEVPDKLFVAMYGNSLYKRVSSEIEEWIYAVDNWRPDSEIWKQWSRDVAKQGKELTLICGRQVDFKTQPESYFVSIKGPRTLICPF